MTENEWLNYLSELEKEALTPLEFRVFEPVRRVIASRVRNGNDLPWDTLISWVEGGAAFRHQLVSDYRAMEQDLTRISDRSRQVDRMMAFLASVTPQEKLAEDRRAFNRWMDAGAVRERTRIILHHSEREIELILHYVRAEWCRSIQKQTNPEHSVKDRNGIEETLWTEFDETPRWQNRMAVLRVWENALALMPVSSRASFLPTRWIEVISAVMEAPEENIWVQKAAFYVMALADPPYCQSMINKRFMARDANPQSIFLRAALIDLQSDRFPPDQFNELLTRIFHQPDPSEHVCLTAAKHLSDLQNESGYSLARSIIQKQVPGSESSKVRTATILALLKIWESTFAKEQMSGLAGKITELILETLEKEENTNVLRAGLEVLGSIARQYGNWLFSHKSGASDAYWDIDDWEFRMLERFNQIISSETVPSFIRRIASRIREGILLHKHPKAAEAIRIIQELATETHPGHSFRLSFDVIADDDLLGRILAFISAEDFGFDARRMKNGYHIFKGDHYQCRLWRIVDEFFHPDPAKRQGFRHSIGRVMKGNIRAHSGILAEMTETKVAGERLFLQEEGTWRPYMPMVDDLLSLCSGSLAGMPVRIYSSDGILELKGPRSMFARMILWWQLTVSYRELNRRRNLSGQQLKDSMTRGLVQIAVEDKGIMIAFIPHSYRYKSKTISVADPTLVHNLYPSVHLQSETGER